MNIIILFINTWSMKVLQRPRDSKITRRTKRFSHREISPCTKRRSHGEFLSSPTTRAFHGLTVRSLIVPREFLMVSPWDISLYQKKISWWISVQLYPHHESLSWTHHEKSRRTKRFSHGLTMRHLIVPKEDLTVSFCPALPPPWEALMVSPWEVLSY